MMGDGENFQIMYCVMQLSSEVLDNTGNKGVAMVDTLGMPTIFLLTVQPTCTGLNCHILLMLKTVDRIVL